MHLFVYLHGFRSSPSSAKALLTRESIDRLMAEGVDLAWYGPQLPPSPSLAIKMVTTFIEQQKYQKLSIIGSSLGGYYATYLAERYGQNCLTTLLNPAVEPARDLEKCIGEQTSWHDEEVFYFRKEYIQELKDLYISKITYPKRYQLLAAKDDEVLNYEEMVRKYPGVYQHILESGGHAISNYSDYLSKVLEFHLD